MSAGHQVGVGPAAAICPVEVLTKSEALSENGPVRRSFNENGSVANYFFHIFGKISAALQVVLDVTLNCFNVIENLLFNNPNHW